MLNAAARTRQIAIKWNDEIRPSKTRTAGHEWKQLLKNKFVFLTQFESTEPSKQKKKWREDLVRAAKETVAEICPDWASEPADHAAYDLIMKEINKTKNPRQAWLSEKAYAWLKCPPPEIERMSWYPGHAIQVAHQLFLNGGGKFASFMKYLEKQKNPAIKDLIQAHAATMSATMNGITLPFCYVHTIAVLC